MSSPIRYSFQRYLLAKQGLDDRSLNREVLERLKQFTTQAGSLRMLELGAGVGTMLERLTARGILTQGEYLGIDADAETVAYGMQRVPDWAARQGYEVRQPANGFMLRNPVTANSLRIDLQMADALEFCQRRENTRAWDLLAAHAFLDLFDLPAVLPVFLQVLRPGGAFYFTLNFDGETVFEPPIDARLDEQIIERYHRSMDDRRVNGIPSGDSRSGRHLFSLLPQAGATILAAGASDWVVYPGPSGYLGDEAYFLHHILHFFEQSLSGHLELDTKRFAAWLERRHTQVEYSELVYIAHQIDFFGKMVL